MQYNIWGYIGNLKLSHIAGVSAGVYSGVHDLKNPIKVTEEISKVASLIEVLNCSVMQHNL